MLNVAGVFTKTKQFENLSKRTDVDVLFFCDLLVLFYMNSDAGPTDIRTFKAAAYRKQLSNRHARCRLRMWQLVFQIEAD